MTKRWRLRVATSVGAVLWVTATTSLIRASQASASRQPSTTVWAGVYTTEQASRGRRAYTKSCSRCHRDDLRGSDKGLPLIGSSFFDHWQDLSLPGLILHIRTAMPHDHAVFISPADARDIASFLLQANGAPAGGAELPDDVAKLGQIVITRPPPK